MKRLFAILLTIVVLGGVLAGCGGGDDAGDGDGTTNSEDSSNGD